MKQYEPGPGEDIGTSAKRAIELADKHNCECEFTFNGTLLIANSNLTADELVNRFHKQLDLDREEYEKSDEYKELVKKSTAEVLELSKQRNVLISHLINLDFHDVSNVLDWMVQFQPISDRVGVAIDSGYIIIHFESKGYLPNANTGEDFDESDKDNFARYIIGQGLDGLNRISSIHPMLVKFTEDWNTKFNKDN